MRQLTNIEFDVLQIIGFTECNSPMVVFDNLSFYGVGEIYATVNNLYREGFVSRRADGVFAVTENGKAATSKTPCSTLGTDCSLTSDTPAPAAAAAAYQTAKGHVVTSEIEESQVTDPPVRSRRQRQADD